MSMSEEQSQSDRPAARHDDSASRGRAASLSLQRKAALCSGRDMWHLEAIPEFSLDSVIVTDGPHGLRNSTTEDNELTGQPATCFPTASGLAATWDAELVAEVGRAIGCEARAQKVTVVLGPGANIKRHPFCGRNFEYMSEDPMLSGEMAAAMIDGIQSVGVGTSLKHFAANNQETRRMIVDAVVDDRALREIYLRGFEIAIRKSQPWTVMIAYNAINGARCSENEWLLGLLRDEWGFEGVVVSDWGASNDRIRGIAAGMDLEMPGSGPLNVDEIVSAVDSGRLATEQLDAVVDRNIDLIERANASLEEDAPADYDAHHELARRASAASTVLLANDGILPLQPSEPLEQAPRIAVIGALGHTPRYQGAGSSQVTPTQIDDLVDEIRNVAGPETTVSCCDGYGKNPDEARPDLLDEAEIVARSADTAIVVVGLPPAYESEGIDRSHMRLPESHNALVRVVTEANPNTVVVLCCGSPVQMPWVERPRAIALAYLGGQGMGRGVADVLFGRVNPSARLAETFPLRQADVASDAWFPGEGRQVQYREGIFVGYRWFHSSDTPVLFPFGHGLGYTEFQYADLEVEGNFDADAPSFGPTVSLQVTNVGERAGSDVVQIYLRCPSSRIERADRVLVGFARTSLSPGASERVRVELDLRAFSFWDVDSKDWQVEAGRYEFLVGASSSDIRVRTEIEIQSKFAVTAEAETESEATHLGRISHATFEDDARFERRLGRPIPKAGTGRPYHRNSTFGEIRKNPLGRLIRAAMLAGARRMMSGDEDDPVSDLLEVFVDEMPLRGLASLSQGKISWKALDRLIRVLNALPNFR